MLCTRLESAADRAFGAQRFSGGRAGRRFAPLSDGAALRAALRAGVGAKSVATTNVRGLQVAFDSLPVAYWLLGPWLLAPGSWP